jgi:hypothetical protein
MPDGEVLMGGTRRGPRRTLREAAARIGVSVEAIRMRVKRGTRRSEKGEDGRRYVYLDEAPDAAQPPADHAGHAYPQIEGRRRHADPLVEELYDEVGYLREQLRREQDAHAEARRIIAALTARIPEVEAPAQDTSPEPPGEPTAATEQPGRVGPQTEVEGPQEAAERVPWWRRIFGE